MVSSAVRREIDRLGGAIDEPFQPRDWREDTPVGERAVPPAVQAVLSVTWPPGHVLVTEEDGYGVTFPQLSSGDPVAEDRACLVIAFNESTQYQWIVDLDDPHPEDPAVYEVDLDL